MITDNSEYAQIKRNGGFDLYYEGGVLLRMSKTYEISAFMRKRLNELLLRSPFKDEKRMAQKIRLSSK